MTHDPPTPVAWLFPGKRLMASPELELIDWRRQVAELYAAVRAESDPERGHARWRAGRDALFRTHPQSPLPAGDPMRETGVRYWPYDAGLRFELPLLPAPPPEQLTVPTVEVTVTLQRAGRVELPTPFDATLDIWWMHEYSGGLFLPLRDGTAGDTSYGGGRYLLDTAKGADLGGTAETVVLDFNFLYHPSCRYNSRWQCPLAPSGNVIAAPVQAGEQL